MSRKTKYIIVMTVLSVGWFLGFYGWYIPKHLNDSKPEMEEYLELNGLTPVEMIDVSGWSGTATWEVTKPDSLGNPVKKIVDIRLVKGNYTLQPH